MSSPDHHPLRRPVRFALAALLCGAAFALAASCGGNDPYDTSCGADDDCVAVHVGSKCSGCGDCRQTVINRADEDRYKEDRREEDSDCSEEVDVGCGGQPCTPPTPFCANGRCALR